MPNGHELVSLLRDPQLTPGRRSVVLDLFARQTGWRPSYEITYPDTSDIACGHLFVEHGLRPVVAITFLNRACFFDSLSVTDLSILLSISYNNLVDWHYFPDDNGFWWIHNRTRPHVRRYVSVVEYPNAWQVEEFDKLVGRRPSPNLPALDTALVNTVSHWKRILAGELQATNITQPISELFNAIFFVRATEDQRRKEHPNENFALLDEADRHTANPRTIRAILAATRRKVGSAPQSLRAHLWDESSLTTFDTLHPSTVRDLLSDFYYNRFAPYKYDFSLVSKHALSCIYEHYISQLKTVVPDQPLLFPEPAEEIPNRDLGGYYTPQYIAGFFARFLANAYTGPTFRQLKIADPACGSGMFLRTVLETQCDPIQNIDLTRIIPTAFANTLGIDVEPNACKAACLSLSLLHLVLTGDFPTKLNIVNDEALLYLSNQPQIHGSFDAVLANPPFVKWENIPLVWRPQVAALLEGFDAPKADLYMALLRIGLNMIRSGGYLLYVLPRTFLLAKNAQKLREHLIHLCWIHFLVDLSEIDVFEDASAYPILLILQKKPERDSSEPKAILVKCSAYPGNALEEALSRSAE
jgi:type I restriction-modification system DNA methylase subunit